MNELIKELAEQAGDDWEHTLPSDREFLEKFAELIVRECISAAEEAQADFYVINNIKTRFGVSE